MIAQPFINTPNFSMPRTLQKARQSTKILTQTPLKTYLTRYREAKKSSKHAFDNSLQ